LLDRNDYKGVVIDFEMVRPQDRDNLNQFIKQLADKLHRSKMQVLIAMPPMTGDRYRLIIVDMTIQHWENLQINYF
jgi:spore germination protein